MTESVEFEAYFGTRTAAAFGVAQRRTDLDRVGGKLDFFPLSIASYEPEDADRGDVVTVTCPEWKAVDAGYV